MDHTQLKAYIGEDELLKNWLYMEEEIEAVIRQEYAQGYMGSEVSVVANYAKMFGNVTHRIECDGHYAEALRDYVHEVEDVINYFNVYKYHADASIEKRDYDELTEIGKGIWSMVIMRLDDAYNLLLRQIA